MSNRLSHDTLERLFLQARSHAAWQDKPVSDNQLHELYDLAKWGPTSMNCLPMRLVFLKSPAAKARLKPALAEGNIDKVLAARSLGLDVGPMSGFDNAQVDQEFFPDGRYKSNFLLNIGYGNHAALHPRGPRFEFDEVCAIY